MNSKAKAREWRNTQRIMAFVNGPRGGRPKPSQPSLLNTLDDMRKHVSLAANTAAAVPSSTERSQLQPPSLITDTPLLELWLKRLDSETLEALYNEYVVECTKAKLLGQRDENAYRANRIREIARREIDYRRTQADQP